MKNATLNDVEGYGEMSCSFSGQVSTSVGWFQPKKAEDLGKFDPFTEATFYGWIEKNHITEAIPVQVMAVDPNSQTVRIAPATHRWPRWIAEIQHEKEGSRTIEFQFPCEPSIEQACGMLQQHLVPKGALLPSVKRSDGEPCRVRVEAAGWSVTSIRSAI